MQRAAQRARTGPQWPMHPVAALLVDFLDVRAVWSIGHEAVDAAPACADPTFLVLADARTRERLQKCPAPGVKLMVVTDGELWQSGSGWRQTSAREAFYDEAQWASGGDVVRVRRKALLVWQR
jgi:hypothetical protein